MPVDLFVKLFSTGNLANFIGYDVEVGKIRVGEEEGECRMDISADMGFTFKNSWLLF